MITNYFIVVSNTLKCGLDNHVWANILKKLELSSELHMILPEDSNI